MAHRNNELRYQLGATLRIISRHAKEFDENCQINIDWVGGHLLGELQAISENADDENVFVLAVTIYRFIIEYDLSRKDQLQSDIRKFVDIVLRESPSFSGNDRQQIDFARHEMPTAILKQIINSDEVGNIRDVRQIAERVEKTIAGWEETLKRTEETTIELAESLKKHTKDFNFVGLREGFADLAIQVEKELSKARTYMVIFGLLAVVPSAFDLSATLGGWADLTKLNTYVLTLLAIGTVSMTALILYYFRIALRKSDSCTAQLTQLRLRMSLCRFIQSYADYSIDIKEKNSEALSKFEAIIFSGLVGSEDKLPSTFDGIEQLTAFAKSITGK
jgi:hypothetical protein